ncbi:hypothetical protein E2542_SST21994 [Spatholobus suberectus]|nr:hypothetical protein E2542_SST21994 [Spatholobus suberectus]
MIIKEVVNPTMTISRIKVFVQQGTSLVWKHTYREANFVADALANHGGGDDSSGSGGRGDSSGGNNDDMVAAVVVEASNDCGDGEDNSGGGEGRDNNGGDGDSGGGGSADYCGGYVGNGDHIVWSILPKHANLNQYVSVTKLSSWWVRRATLLSRNVSRPVLGGTFALAGFCLQSSLIMYHFAMSKGNCPLRG